MKQSIYNNFLPYEGKYIGHNGLSNQFIVIEPLLYDLITSSEVHGNISELKDIHNDFYKHLVSNGFIVSKEKNELIECLKMLNKNDTDDTHYELHINPTMNCNFNCWYCYETHISDSKLNDKTKINIVNFARKLINEKSSLKSFQLNWFGGEALLFFNKTIVPILKEVQLLCNNKNIKFFSLITTNGLLVNDSMIEKCLTYNLKRFQITLDGHREKHDKVRFISKSRGSYDRIVSNIKKLVRNGINVNVRINCSKETFDGIEEIANDFNELEEESRQFITFDFHEVWQTEEDLSFDVKKYIDIFRLKKFKVSSLDINYFGIGCYADRINHANINYNGEVFKCTARDYTTENSEGILTDDAEIVWNEKYHQRFKKKYTNKPCLECSIFPVCGGGCSQMTLENEKDYCVYNFDENKKMDVILSNFLATIEK